ncbi:MAG: hypothetical protein ACYTA3_14625 [Planctomycetota bacterium]|jgi:hypothetical protein
MSIVKNKNGVKRWKKTHKKKRKKKNKTRKIFKSKLKNVGHEKKITVKILKSFKKKYGVTTTGNKKEMAEGLWTVHGGSMSDHDLLLIIPLLSKRDKKEAEKLLSDRNKTHITDYKGMWIPQPKPLRKMSRKEMIKHLRHFRNVWERETTRSQDLSDERLDEESDKDLRGLLEFYFSNEAKQIAGDWLRKNY